MTRITLVLVGALVALALAAPAHATLNACAAAKKLCVAKKTAALLKCHSKNEKPPAGMTPAKFAECLQKAKIKFDGGTNPAKGCFAKLEAKYGIGCLTSGDTAALEAKVDAYVDDVVCALDSAGGTCPTPTATPTPAPTPTADCGNGIQDGDETDDDCGGNDCPDCGLGGGCLAHSDCVATTFCNMGTCGCAPGQTNCNMSVGDACEVATGSDPNNCGMCGFVCSIPNAVESCVMSTCLVGSCDVNYGNCDNVGANGCEVFLLGDNNHCGACNAPCPIGENCSMGNCF